MHSSCSLYGNELSGTIPVEIGEMTKLWHVGKIVHLL